MEADLSFQLLTAPLCCKARNQTVSAIGSTQASSLPSAEEGTKATTLITSDQIEQHQAYFIQSVLGISAINIIRSPAAVRERLFESFLGGSKWLSTITQQRAIVTRLKDWFTSSKYKQAQTDATDAVLLISFAEKWKDRRFLFAAKAKYISAVHQLARDLRKPGAVTNDALLRATDALGVCELFTELSQGAWRQHARGLCALLRTRGLALLVELLKTERGRELVLGALHVGVIDAHLTRQSWLFSETQRNQVVEARCPGRMWCLFHVAALLSTLLERVDQETSVDKRPLLSELLALESRYQRWLLCWYKEIPGLPVRVVDIKRFPTFIKEYGQASTCFPTALQFSSAPVALGHIYYWTQLLPLRLAIHDLSGKSQPAVDADQRILAASKMIESADLICQSIPTLSTFDQTDTLGESVKSGLMWALDCYEKQQDQAKIELCRAMVAHHSAPKCWKLYRGLWMEGSGFLMRRVLWQECVGPSRCATRMYREAES